MRSRNLMWKNHDRHDIVQGASSFRFRRVAARFEKLDERLLGFIYIAGIMKWIH
jgi:hypothetical protein